MFSHFFSAFWKTFLNLKMLIIRSKFWVFLCNINKQTRSKLVYGLSACLPALLSDLVRKGFHILTYCRISWEYWNYEPPEMERMVQLNVVFKEEELPVYNTSTDLLQFTVHFREGDNFCGVSLALRFCAVPRWVFDRDIVPSI